MSGPAKILERIKRDYDPQLFDVLSEQLSSPDLQSLLLEVFRRRAGRLTPQHLARQFKENRFVQPSTIDPRLFMQLDEIALSLLPGYEAVELSPLSALGCNSIIAPVHQNNAVTTIRNTEVCSDSTNVLALLAAQQRAELLRANAKSTQTVKLCASHRVVRGQLFQGAGSVPHFRLFAMVTAGRDRGSFLFELESLRQHIDFYLRFFQEINRVGFQLEHITTVITDFSRQRVNSILGRVITPLADLFKNVAFRMDQERELAGYYSDIGFHILAGTPDGEEFLLVDGGSTNWTQQLLNNKKERLFTSGMGTERLCLCFRGASVGNLSKTD